MLELQPCNVVRERMRARLLADLDLVRRAKPVWTDTGSWESLGLVSYTVCTLGLIFIVHTVYKFVGESECGPFTLWLIVLTTQYTPAGLRVLRKVLQAFTSLAAKMCACLGCGRTQSWVESQTTLFDAELDIASVSTSLQNADSSAPDGDSHLAHQAITLVTLVTWVTALRQAQVHLHIPTSCVRFWSIECMHDRATASKAIKSE